MTTNFLAMFQCLQVSDNRTKQNFIQYQLGLKQEQSHLSSLMIPVIVKKKQYLKNYRPQGGKSICFLKAICLFFKTSKMGFMVYSVRF